MFIETLLCMQMAIFYEARNEPLVGQIAVAEVIGNRVMSPQFPDTVCEVVKQRTRIKVVNKKGEVIRQFWRCQFSFYCDGKPDNMPNKKARTQSMVIAISYIMGNAEQQLSEDCLYYHASYVNPRWFKRLTKHIMIGDHIFYVDNRGKVPIPIPRPEIMHG